MSLESEMDIIAENERKVDKFAEKYFNNSNIAVHIFGTPDITKRNQEKPYGHDEKAHKRRFIKYAEIIFECDKVLEKNYSYF
jgi:hypothetical protein